MPANGIPWRVPVLPVAKGSTATWYVPESNEETTAVKSKGRSLSIEA